MKINFIGSASDDVTGSMIMLKLDNGKNILLDCGMTQTNNLFKDYRINSADFTFKVKDIDSTILSHMHCDHAGLLPKLYNRGYRDKLFVPFQSKAILKDMLDDSCYIVSKTQSYIQSQGKKN